MEFLRAITTEGSHWGEGIFLKRMAVSKEDYGRFIIWQWERDPFVKWVKENFENKNKFYIHNVKSEYREELVFDALKNKWNIKRRLT